MLLITQVLELPTSLLSSFLPCPLTLALSVALGVHTSSWVSFWRPGYLPSSIRYSLEPYPVLTLRHLFSSETVRGKGDTIW